MGWKFRLMRDPDPAAGGGGAGTELAKINIEGDPSKGISNWTEVFPEEIRKNPIFAKYKTPQDLVKGVDSMTEMIGRKGVILPTDKSTAEEVQSFYNQLGRPEKFDGYKLTKLEGLHPSIKVTPESENGWRQVAHTMGLPQVTADNLNQWWLKTVDAAMKAQDASALKSRQDGETALRSAWKENYDVNYKAAQQAMKVFGSESALKKLGDLGSDPEIVQMFYNIGKKITMDTTHAGGDGSGSGGEVRTVEQAKARLTEINAMFSDPKSPLMDQNHKDHDAVTQERTKLYEQINAPKT